VRQDVEAYEAAYRRGWSRDWLAGPVSWAADWNWCNRQRCNFAVASKNSKQLAVGSRHAPVAPLRSEIQIRHTDNQHRSPRCSLGTGPRSTRSPHAGRPPLGVEGEPVELAGGPRGVRPCEEQFVGCPMAAAVEDGHGQ
jgi:hypothetical protein